MRDAGVIADHGRATACLRGGVRAMGADLLYELIESVGEADAPQLTR